MPLQRPRRERSRERTPPRVEAPRRAKTPPAAPAPTTTAAAAAAATDAPVAAPETAVEGKDVQSGSEEGEIEED